MSKEAMKLALQQALDKMAENARELGIQMQPEEPRAWFTVDELNAWADKKLKENPQWAEQPAQQEPVASDFEKWLGQPSYHDGFGRSPDLWSLKQIQAAVAAMLAAAPQPAQQEPVNEGWKLVPVEPTEDMWKAVNKLDDEMAAGSYDGKGCSIEQAWNCLLDAAPTPPAQRTWVGLTEDEIYMNCPNWLSQEQCKVWIQQIEAKLKEKNT